MKDSEGPDLKGVREQGSGPDIVAKAPLTDEVIEKKVRFWKVVAITAGLVSCGGFVGLLVVVRSLARDLSGLLYSAILFCFALLVWIVLCVLATNAIVKIRSLNLQRGRHGAKDYIVPIIGLVLVLLPCIVIEVLDYLKADI